MRAGVVVAACVALLSGGVRAKESDAASDAQHRIAMYVAAAVDSLDDALVGLDAALASNGVNARHPLVKQATRQARTRYKHVEGIIEFYAPALAAAFNARRQELDDDDVPPPSSSALAGFPALEAIALRPPTRGATDSARRVVQDMRAVSSRLGTLAPALRPSEAQVIELARLELARIETLGISGFDAPRSGDAMIEGAQAMAGVRALMKTMGTSYWAAHVRQLDCVDSTMSRAMDYLNAHVNFERFDRLAFITGYAEPALRAIDQLRRAANITPVRIQRAWRADEASPFAAGAFDARAYAPSGTPPRSEALIALGNRLFMEPALSGNGARSCASCHQPDRAFTDGRTTPAGLNPGLRVSRNTPTLLNAALQPAQFADERSVTLEDQVLTVLASPAEMGSNIARAVAAVSARPGYDTAFTRAFGGNESAVSARHLQQALAAYERTLTGLDTRFDRAVRGDTAALTAQERRGFSLFMGKGGCGTCHFAPLFNGNTPPRYLSSDVEVIGTPRSSRVFAEPDPDSGRARIDGLPQHYRSFKTPSLRNITRTAPYMHNGAFATLDDVLAFYEKGGGVGAGAKIANQTLAADTLHLDTDERRAIIAFLGSLTDADRPRPTPR